MAYSGQVYFQEGLSLVMLDMMNLYSYAFSGCIFIGVFVFLVSFFMVRCTSLSMYFWEEYILELIWTVIPIVILVFLGFFSLRLLYMMNEVVEFKVSVKVTGHQWYWSYEYDYMNSCGYDSFMLLEGGNEDFFRNLDVSSRLVLPWGVIIRSVVTSADVLHSWSVPSLGVKIDAVPGRINQVSFEIPRPGVYYGQCSEICGAFHSFMPIVLEVVDVGSYVEFIMS